MTAKASTLTALALMLCSPNVPAEIYKCVISGATTYQQAECPAGAKHVNRRKPPQKRTSRTHSVAVLSHFNAHDKELLKAHATGIGIGMSSAALILSWGYPDQINLSADDPQHWVYENAEQRTHVYLIDRKVVKWKQSK